MKFALVNNQRQEATPKTKGICPVCNTTVISKCGSKKAHHWAHETKQDCKNDRWETEGPWHRKWKNKFPIEWQEQITIVNNEKNVADIKTPQNLVIEFQHSSIAPDEQKSREKAYDNMIWVVDGTRLKYDFPRFRKKIIENSHLYFKLNKQNWKLFSIEFYDEVFPKSWITCSVPVIFDFLGEVEEKGADVFQKFLYCLLPTTKIRKNEWNNAFLFYMPRKDFLPFILNNEWENFYSNLLSNIEKKNIEEKEEWDRYYREEIEKFKRDCVEINNKIFVDKYGFKRKL